jgi:hypothetical protein
MRNTLHRNVGGQRVELFCFAWWFLAQILSGTDANRLPMDLAAGSDSRRRAGPSSRRRQEVAGSFPGRPSRRATSSASGTATSSPASTPHTPLTCASWPATAPASAGAVIVASQSARVAYSDRGRVRRQHRHRPPALGPDRRGAVPAVLYGQITVNARPPQRRPGVYCDMVTPTPSPCAGCEAAGW